MKKSILLFGLLLTLNACYSNPENSVISGKLLGHDGQPMAKAQVYLSKYNMEGILKTIDVAKDGSFEIEFEDNGIHFFNCIGTNHYPLRFPLVDKKPSREQLTIQLKHYEYVDDLNKLIITYGFDEFSSGINRPMTQQANGSFIFELDTTASTVAYKIRGAEKNGRTIHGTQSEDFTIDEFGQYSSIVKITNGKFRIVFDPKKLSRAQPKNEVMVQFDNPGSIQAKFYALAYEHKQRSEKYWSTRRAYMKAHSGDMSEFSYDWSADLERLEKGIRQKENSIFRQVLLVQYLMVGRLAEQEKLDKELVSYAFNEIPATSALWTLLPHPMIIDWASEWTGEKEKYEDYIDHVLDQHGSRRLRENLLYLKLSEASEKEDTAAVKLFFNRIMSEFAGTWLADIANQIHNQTIIKGEQVPTFSVASLDNSDVVYTNESLKSKVYLMDFWAVWCVPCIAEMPNLHNAYEKFKDKNFEILSLSFDQKPEAVVKFRNKKWKMPWLHTFVENGYESEIAKTFKVWGIPKLILVDGSTNTIFATDGELKGEKLEKTLGSVLGK